MHLLRRAARALLMNLTPGPTHFHPGPAMPYRCTDEDCLSASVHTFALAA
jgi:hypothetical protein